MAAVYVDAPRLWDAFRRTDGREVRQPHRWCHLWADDVEELHAFAGRLGLNRRWFQDRSYFPHYDLMGDRMRARAVALGARPVSDAQVVAWVRARRLKGNPGRPPKAPTRTGRQAPPAPRHAAGAGEGEAVPSPPRARFHGGRTG